MIRDALAGAARPARADAARRARRARRVARRRHGDDRRLLARDRLRPRRRAVRPARRARPLHRAAPRARSTRASSALPNLEARSYRNEQLDQRLRVRQPRDAARARSRRCSAGAAATSIVDGRDLRDGEVGEVVIERGLAREWDIGVGDTLTVAGGRYRLGLGDLRVVGIAVSPDNVAFPLASAARVYVSEQEFINALGLARRVRPEHRAAVAQRPVQGRRHADPGARGRVRAREAAVHHPHGREDPALAGGGDRDLAARRVLARRAGRRRDDARRGRARRGPAPPDRASACSARSASARAGSPPSRPSRRRSSRSRPRPLGIALGALVVARPAADLLAALNELGPGPALAAPAARRAARGRRRRRHRRHLAGLARRPPPAGRDPPRRRPRRPRTVARQRSAAGCSRSACASPPPRAGAGSRRSRRSRSAPGVVTLMLALASLLERLREDPGTIGKRYQLAVSLDAGAIAGRAADPGVDAVGQRYSIDAADSFRLGEPVRLVAYPGDHTNFEDPPLAEGRRIRAPNEVEVGQGMADALGLRPGQRARDADPRGRRGALPRQRHRARARERRADRVGRARPAARPAPRPQPAGRGAR